METKTRLDADQLKIAKFTGNNALVIAGAGSGKTTAIVERCVDLVKAGVRAESILMMTFTNKAAKEMLERTETILKSQGLPLSLPNITTFHSFGHKLIIKNYDLFFRDRNPSLIDPKDAKKMQLALIGEVIKPENVKIALELYSFIRNEGLDSNDDDDIEIITDILKKQGFDDQEARYTILAWQEYECEKSEYNVLDYDDLINLPIVALKENPDFREKVQRFLSHVIIDEAQDNNESMFKLLLQLAPPNLEYSPKTMLVGDPKQSINAWRGAHPENMMRYQKAYKADILIMKRNYRSVPSIVNATTHLIKNNPEICVIDNDAKPVRTEHEQAIIEVKESDTGNEMFKNTIKSIKNDISQGVPLNEIAILYRTNKIAGLIEPYLIQSGIPYQVKKGIALLEKPEIKMMLAFARLATNPRDIMAFSYISNIIPGLGKKRLEDIEEQVKLDHLSVFEATKTLKGRVGQDIEYWAFAINRLKEIGPLKLKAIMNHKHFKGWIEKRTEANMKAANIFKPKNFELWEKNKQGLPITDDEKKIIEEITENCQKYQNNYLGRVKEAAFNLNLVQETIATRIKNENITDIDKQWSEMMEMIARPPDEDKETIKQVTLSTQHGSKGAEWQTVHLVAFSEGLSPLKDEEGVVDDIEAERNLAYVAMTRAKDKLYVSTSKTLNLKRGKGDEKTSPSRFIQEANLTIQPAITNSVFVSKSSSIRLQ